ncbi:MgtC/SapB family protein [Planococcus lenghuensis]|uniref:ACT domain-containing protein n=1 Tax=Planococcus lenghuensis TaxID=2213202 RepID=A0A1Q2L052_9BACL|nr:MgtC/SapB family protein [Planococcus lenghuensis]AQQ53776.1 hypothetical protein B0X71_12235 [Planococcus lenghuensis]
MDFFPPETATITTRLIIAALLCGAIGFERETQQHPAGFRTHLLVGMSSCLMMLLSIQGFDSFLSSKYEGFVQYDPTRIPSYVISGIGFLGAGTILVNKGAIKGLTTAASIWAAAGIGLVVGIGMFYAALLATIIALITLYVFAKLEHKYLTSRRDSRLIIIAENTPGILTSLNELMAERKVRVTEFNLRNVDNYEDTPLIEYSFSFKHLPPDKLISLIEQLEQLESVRRVTR